MNYLDGKKVKVGDRVKLGQDEDCISLNKG